MAVLGDKFVCRYVCGRATATQKEGRKYTETDEWTKGGIDECTDSYRHR
jgi:hypothetical protein